MVHLAAIGTTEWLLIICAAAILFGARKIPELAHSLGSSVHQFKKGMKDGAEGKGEERLGRGKES